MIRIGGSISVHGCWFLLLLIHLWVYLAVGSLIRIGGSTSVILFLLVHSNSFCFLAFLVSFFFVSGVLRVQKHTFVCLYGVVDIFSTFI